MTTTERLTLHGLLVMVLLFLIIVVCVTHYNCNILPLKMAEKGYCWRSVPSNPQYLTYQPCAPEVKEPTR